MTLYIDKKNTFNILIILYVMIIIYFVYIIMINNNNLLIKMVFLAFTYIIAGYFS